MTPVHSADWTDADVQAYRVFCAAVGISDLAVPLTVWSNESGNSASAHNPNGDASGLFQLMPATARQLGYNVTVDPHLAAFRALSIASQLSWATRYYSAHKGHIGTVGQFYCSTFLPILTDHADHPDYLLCGAQGQGPLLIPDSKAAYSQNKGFDVHGRGSIIVQDLIDAAYRASNAKTAELIQRAKDLAAAPASP